MKKYIVLSLALALAMGFTACKDDNDNSAKPVIPLTEVGHDNSLMAHPGHDLHLEADIVAEGLIQRIDIEIHQEEKGSFEIVESFTEGKYVGIKNTEFHEHIDIPAEAPLGKYHLHFTVTDAEGQQTTAESPLTLVEGDDDDDEEHHHED